MKRWMKIIAWSVGSLLLLFFLFGLWYKQTYSMKTARSFHVNDASLPYHILIATQGSNFKDSVVQNVIAELRTQQAFIAVIDVAGLAEVKEEDWTAIVILHTWEYSKPPDAVDTFIRSIINKNKLIVLTTSGDGNFKFDGVDAISSASALSEIPSKSQEIIARVSRLIQ